MKPFTKKQAKEFFDLLAKAHPDPKTELNSVNNYTLLVAVALSAQSTDVGVNKATKELFKIVTTPYQMLELGEDGLKKYIKTIGLYNTKAKNVIKAARLLVDLHGGEVPDERKALEALPGVGRKTANVILNVAFGHPTIAVDTHLFRLGNRIGIAPGKTPLEVEKAYEKIIPKEHIHDAHIALILHGRYTCKAKNPLCDQCPVRHLCPYPLEQV
tara:strand:- start:709 stop:1350 length:642 start_codon:yes stop_codon:yes gene_type:complete